MRRRAALVASAVALAAAGVLLGTACGYEGTVTASPQTVEGTVPTAPTETGPQLPAFPEGNVDAGEGVFASAGCGGCHVLEAAGSTGTVGPNLDEAQPDLDLIHTRVYLGQGAMPSFKDQLSLQQIADVSAYVYSSTHGGAAPPPSTGTTPTETTETTATETTATETTETETTETETTATETTETETTETETTATETTPTETSGSAAPGDAAAGKTVFATAGCGSCHTLVAAGSSGTIGPNLDDAQPELSLVVDRVTNGRGAMPSFRGTLSEQQIQDVAAFVVESTRG